MQSRNRPEPPVRANNARQCLVPTGNSQWAHVCSQCLALSKCNTFSGAAVIHANQDRRNLAALDGIGRVERSVRVGTGQDARAVEVVDFRRKRIAGLHVGNRVVRNRIHITQVVRRRVEDVDKFRARDCGVHLRSRVAAICSVKKSAKCDFFLNLMKKSLTFRLWQNCEIDLGERRCSPCIVHAAGDSAHHRQRRYGA